MELLESDDVARAVREAAERGEVIGGAVARTIASFWHSPSRRDREITRLSHTGKVEDWIELRDLVEYNIEHNPEDVELPALLAWVRKHMDCPECGPATRKLAGIYLGANNATSVEVCTECRRYDSDIEAAVVVAKLWPEGVTTVAFFQYDPDADRKLSRLAANGELGVDYDPAEYGVELRRYRPDEERKADDCLRHGEYPWVELHGRPIDWEHARLVAATVGEEL